MSLTVVTPAAVRTSTRIQATDTPGDISVERLKLQSSLKGAGLATLDVTSQITSGSYTDSFTAAPTLTFTAIDRGYVALNSGIFDDDVELELDGIPFMLTNVDLTGPEMLQLEWEHKIVALLRRHRSFLSVQRGAMTRAEFIELMLREILPDFPDIVYVCPEINAVQPIAAPKKSGRSLTAKTLASKATTKNYNASGFTASSLTIKTWDGGSAVLTTRLLQNAATVLQTCAQDNAPAKATLAVMEACCVEPATAGSAANPFGNPNFGDGTSKGILQVTAATAQSLGIDPLNIEQCVHAFLTTGFTGVGGAISLARKNPGWTAGQIAAKVQGSAFPARYQQAETGARAVIAAYGGVKTTASGTTMVLSGDIAATKQYNFTRGYSGQKEDSYTCALRLAGQVMWRFFISGARTVYFVTDEDLLATQEVYTISPDTEGVAQPTFSIEKGARTVVEHRHRVPKPSEGQVAVRIKRWEANVGNVITLEGYGPADDRWLLKETERDLFDRAGTIYFQSPQKPLPEPAATVSTNTQPTAPGSSPSLTSGNVVDRVYAAAQAISARDLPYVWGGGHTGSWQTAAKATGYDCSSSVSMALYAAGLMAAFPNGPIVSGDFVNWGQPGRGSQMTVWCNGVHVFIEFYGRPAKRFDTVPGGSGGAGPHLRYTAPVEALDAFTPRHWPGF